MKFPTLTGSMVAILLCCYFLRGVSLLCLLPPFEGWDEYQHVGYVDHCANYSTPAIYGETKLSRDFARAVAQFPQPKDALSQLTSAQTYEQFWSADQKPSPMLSEIGFYQSQHPFLYYRLMARIYRCCGGRSNLPLAVAVLRLVNLLLGTLAIGMILLWIRCTLPGKTALIAACCMSFHPLLLLNCTRVANDALAFCLGTGVVIACLTLGKSLRGGIESRRFNLTVSSLSLILPLSVLAKATNLILVPLVVFAFIALAIAQPSKLKKILMWFAVIVFAFAGITWRYFSFNLHHFGQITPMQEAIVNHLAGRSLPTILKSPPLMSWPIWTWSLWSGNALWVGGWSFLQPPFVFKLLYDLLIAFGIVSLAVQVLRKRLPLQIDQVCFLLLLLIFAEAGLMYHAVQAYSAWQGRVTTNPWYAAVAIPWLLILLIAALHSYGRMGKTIAIAIPLLYLICESTGELYLMPRFYYHTQTLSILAERINLLHPAAFGFTTLVAATSASLGLVFTLIFIKFRL